MKDFKRYPKIYRFGTEETDGILNGKCYIQEKIDGANTSIWINNGEIQYGSRNQVLGSGFNGFVDYVKNHEGIKKYLTKNPTHRLYGEWLVQHTIKYNELKYKQFYLFDIEVDDKFLKSSDVEKEATKYGILFPHTFAVLENPNIEDVKKFVGTSFLGKKGEGVVIKNFEFINKFGNSTYAKIVEDSFRENSSIIFGGNCKNTESYKEIYLINKYITLARVQKIINKIQPTVDKKLGREHTSRIINSVYYDMLTEEIWDIQNKFDSINFKQLHRLSCKKASIIYQDILDNNISVAFNTEQK